MLVEDNINRIQVSLKNTLRKTGRVLLCTLFFNLFTFNNLFANPEGGVIASGSATISQSGNVTQINQASDKAIINWNSFNIGAKETTQFVQPNSNSVALNRINADQGASQIYGVLTANGKIILVNQAGIYFGPGSRVDVAGLIASTANISDASFLSGQYIFHQSSEAQIINQGYLKAAQHGLVALIGNNVRNDGTIDVQGGSVILASGKTFIVNLDGNQLINFAVDEMARDANGNVIPISTVAAADIVDHIVNLDGISQAQSVTQQNGVIILSENSHVNVSNSSGKGGSAFVLGKKVSAHGKISATGNEKGGFVETSGNYLNISGIRVETNHGSWLLDPTDVTITDDPTSGETFSSNTYTPNVSGSIVSNILASDLIDNLANNDITVTTTNGSGIGNGDISVDAELIWTSTHTLTLNATRNIYLNWDITAINGGLTLSASNGAQSLTGGTIGTGTIGTTPGTVEVNINVANFILSQGQWFQSSASLPTFSVTNNFQIANGSAYNNYYNAQFTRLSTTSSPYGISDVFGLQGIATGPLSASYVLSSNINASATSNWNSGAGFVPIGTDSSRFTGTLEGNNYFISSLYINRPSTNEVGLFAASDGATISNLTLLSPTVTGNDYTAALIGLLDNTSSVSNVGILNAKIIGASNVGGLVGVPDNGTSISTSFTTGTISGISNVGGFAGNSGATISDSYSTASVSGAGNGGNQGTGGFLGRAAFYSVTTNSYSSGSVSGNNVGGFVGNVEGSPTDSGNFWDTTTSGQSSSGFGTGNTISDMMTLSNFSGAGWSITATPSTSSTKPSGSWFIFEGNTRPILLMEQTTSITNAHQLQMMGSTLGASYTVANNIDLSATTNSPLYNSEIWGGAITNKGFVPVGDSSNGFTGNFNGNSYAISNLYIYRPSTDTVGLFGEVTSSGSLIQNLALLDVSITGQTQVGALVGALDDGTVSNMYITGSVTGIGYNIGGLAGSIGTATNLNGTIQNSGFNGTVIGTTSTGGLVGYSSGTINYSWTSGNVIGTGISGGLVGYAGPGSATGIISNSYSTANVDVGIGSNAGGLVGYTNAMDISNSWSSGAVTGTGTNIGGFLGGNQNTLVLNNNFFDTTTSGIDSSAGCGFQSNCSGLFGLTTADTMSYSAISSIFGTSTGATNGGITDTPSLTSTVPDYTWFMFDGSTRPMLLAEHSTTIRNAHQLQLMGSTLDASYTLANNIDLSSSLTNTADSWGTNYNTSTGAGFLPIGPLVAYQFTGTLNGDNYTIDNLYINMTTTSSYFWIGLFGLLHHDGITVENLRLTNVNITAPVAGNAGGITGNLMGTSQIQNVYVSGSISAEGPAGGIVGTTNSTNTSYAISHAVNAASITSNHTSGGPWGAGGIVGNIFNAAAIIENSYNIGTVTATGVNNPAGGLVGFFSNGNGGSYTDPVISQSFSTGALSGTGSVGGIIGNSSFTGVDIFGSSASAPNSFWDSDTSSASTLSAVGGGTGTTSGFTVTPTGQTTTSLMTLSTYTGAGGNWSTSTGSGGITSTPSSNGIAPSYDWFIFEDSTRPMLLMEYSTTISNAHQLQLMGSTLGANYTLGTNIDLSATGNSSTYNSEVWGGATINQGFAPIGNTSYSFTGTFNGAGYSISDLYINLPSTDSVGLFGDINGATLTRIGLINPSVTGNNQTGALLGSTSGMSIISKIAINNAAVTGNINVGGLAGLPDSQGPISQSYVTGSVTGVNTVGGFIGDSGVNVSDSWAGVTVTSTGSGTDQGAGGFIGRTASYASTANSYSSGTVSGSNPYIGGFIGWNESPGSTLSNNFFDSTIFGSSTAIGGGITSVGTDVQAKTTTEMMTATTFSSWGSNISSTGSASSTAPSSTWFIFDGNTRPLLMMEYSTTITNAHQLQLMGSTLGANYTLANNIDLSSALTNTADVWGTNYNTPTGSGFVPIGVVGNNFMGTLDGGGFAINNLYINRPSTQYVGLIGALGDYYGSTLIVQHLALLNANVTGGDSYVGTLIGGHDFGNGGGKVQQVMATGSVTAASDAAFVGGLIGWDNLSFTQNSFSAVNVYVPGSSSGVGSFVGYAGAYSYLFNNLSTGYVDATADIDDNVHGFMGGEFGSDQATQIFNNFWDTDTSGKSTSSENATITGGCFTGTCANGGTVSLSSLTTYTDAGWDIAVAPSNSTWGIIDGKSYPYLTFAYSSTPRAISGTSNLGANQTVQMAANGSDVTSSGFTQGTTLTGANGFYYFLEPNAVITDSDSLLTYSTTGTNANAVTLAPSSGGSITGLTLTGNNVTIGDDNTNTVTHTQMQIAKGSLSAGLLYSTSGANLIISSSNTLTSSSTTTYSPDGNLTMGTGLATFNGPVYLEADSTFTSSNGGFIFNSTLAGGHDINIANNSGAIAFNGLVGGITGSTIGTGDTTTINTTTFITTGAQTFNSPIILTDSLTFYSSTGAGITFGSTIDGAQTILIANNSGTTTFNGIVGGSTPLASLLIGSGNNTIFGSSNSGVTTTGIQTYNSGLTLNASSTTLNTTSVTGNGTSTYDITLNGTTFTGNTLILKPAKWAKLNDALSGSSLTLLLNSTADYVANNFQPGTSASVALTGTFNLQSGGWNQNTVSPASFSASNFQLNSGNGPVSTVQFLRVAGGNGTSGNPYQLTDIYGLEGIGSNTTTLGNSWLLNNNIDASATSGWNSGAGFIPIGDASYDFSGNFDGSNYIIDHLYENTTADLGGLFANVSLGSNAISNVLLTNVNLTSKLYVGGIAGQSTGGTFNNIGVTGNITATGNGSSYNSAIGGIVGVIGGTNIGASLTNVWSNVAIVSSNPYGSGLGGLIGSTLTYSNTPLDITDAYALGTINDTANGSSLAGGLMGYMRSQLTITRAYSAVYITGTPFPAGIIGGFDDSSGTITASNVYWDADFSGLTNGFNLHYTGNNTAGMTGLTTQQLMSFNNYSAWSNNITLSSDNTASTWKIIDGKSYPYLTFTYSSTPRAISGYSTAGVNSAMQLAVNAINVTNSGLTYGTTRTGATSGFYYFLEPNSSISDGSTVSVSGTSVNTNAAISSSTTAPASGGSISNFNVAGSGQNITLTSFNDVTTYGVLVGNTWIVEAGNNINVTGNINWSTTKAVTLYSLDTITINAPITTSTGSLNLYANNTTQSITTDYTNGSINVANFDLLQGQWYQVNSTLPSFSANDFTLNSAQGLGTALQFIRATGGDGSSGSPYQIVDVYGLQGIISNATTLSQHWQLNSDIDASATSTWSAGFIPIGNQSWAITHYFTGTFDGQNHTISNLTINTTSGDDIGLFGDITTGAIVENVILSNISLDAIFGGNVGGLVGKNNGGTITNVGVSGAINSGYVAGGIVGDNHGTLSNSWNSASVTGSQDGWSGGIAGLNETSGSINNTFNIGNISGIGYMYTGGIAGENYGSISNSYSISSTITVLSPSGPPSIGGLVGYLDSTGSITNSFASSTIIASSSITGGLVGSADSGATITSSFWDVATSGQTSGIGSDGGTTGTPQAGCFGNTTCASGAVDLTQQSTFTGWDFTNTWGVFGNGPGYPFLKTIYTLSPRTVSGSSNLAPGSTVQLAINGSNIINNQLILGTTTTGANGFYYFIEPNGTIPDGAQILASNTANNAYGITVTGPGGELSSDNYAGLNLHSNTVSVSNDNSYDQITFSNNSNISLASFLATYPSLPYSISGNNLTIGTSGTPNISLYVNGPQFTIYALDGNITTYNGTGTGNLTFTGPVSLATDSALTTANGGITFDGTIDGAHALTIANNSGSISFGGIVGGSSELTGLTIGTGDATAINTTSIATTNSQTWNSAITLGADATLTSDTGTLNFGSTISGAHSLTLSSVANAIDLPTITLTSSGALAITAGGNITQSGALSIAGTASFSAGAHAITLTNSGNNFTGAMTLSNSGANDVSLTNSIATSLAASSIGQNLTLTSTSGAITQTGALTVGGTSSFSAGAHAITLTQANSFTGAVTLSNSGAFDVSLTNSIATSLAASSIGQNLTLTSTSGAISQTGALTIGGTSNFSAGAHAITLTQANSFTGAITLSNSGAFDVSLTNSIATSLAASSVGQNLTVTSTSGAISQTGAISVGGTSSFSAGANAITLTQANSFTGAITLSNSGANDVSLTNSVATALAASTIGQNLTVTSTSGAISQTGALSVGGTSFFSAGANAITLTNSSNTFSGTVAFSNSGTNDISVSNNAAMNLAASTIGQSLTATTTASLLTVSGNITSSNNGTLSLTGTGFTLNASTNLTAGSGTININARTGTLNVGAGSLLLSSNNIALIGDVMSLNTSAQIGGTAASTGNASSVTLTESTANTSIGIAGGAGSLSFSTAQVDTIRSSTVTIGDSSSGAMTVSTWTPAINSLSTLNLTTGSSLTFSGAVNGSFALVTNSTGTTAISAAMGGSTALTSLNITGTVSLGANVTTTNAQTYNNAMTLTGNPTLTSSSSGNIYVGSTLDDNSSGAHSVAINTAGVTTLNGSVGNTFAPSSITTDSAGSTVVNGSSVTTTGNQTYNDPITNIGSTGTNFVSTAGGAISLANTSNNFATSSSAPISVNISGGTNNATLYNTNTLVFGNSNISGALNVTTAGTGNAISQKAGTALTVGSLSLVANNSPITLTGNNSISSLNVLITGTSKNNVTINDPNPLLTITGMDTSGGGGDIIIDHIGSIEVTGVVTSGTGAIALNANAADETLTISTGSVSGTGGITYTADNMVLTGTTNAGASGTLTLKPYSTGQLINLGGADSTGTLGLTQTELNTLTAGTLRIGQSTSGAITLTSNMNSPASTLSLINNAAITQNASSLLTATNLRISSAGPVTLNLSNSITKLAANLTGNGNAFIFNNSSGITLDAVDGISGITTTNADVTLSGTSFTNNIGSSAISTGSGRFLVWSVNPNNDNKNGLSYSFKQYNATYGVTTVSGSGNGFLYTLNPTSGFSLSLTGTVTKAIDGNTVATLTMSNYSYAAAVLFHDNIIQFNSGDLIALPLTGNYAQSTAGININVLVSGISVYDPDNGSAILYGYGSVPSSLNANIGTIDDSSSSSSSSSSNNVASIITGGNQAAAANTSSASNPSSPSSSSPISSSSDSTTSLNINSDSSNTAIVNAILNPSGGATTTNNSSSNFVNTPPTSQSFSVCGG
ncbi:MAG: filamentous hemagglutinin N-terminal domain-containing protein [Gammaproteobacteria bacterium]|nr:filamentous hemagglutinin N-terminal domain-containing protein [Gammaproteobacteria bacterium]